MLVEQAVFYAALCLLVLIAVPYAGVDPYWDAMFQSGIYTLAAVWLLGGNLFDSRLVQYKHLFLPLAALAALAAIQILPLWQTPHEQIGITVSQTISADSFETRKWIFKFLAFVLLGAILLRGTHSQRRLRAVVRVVLGIAVLSAAFGMLAQASGITGENEFFPRLSPRRSYAQFVNKAHFAFLMEMAIGLAFGLVVGKKLSNARRAVYFVAALFLCVALALAASRGGVMSLLGETALLGLLYPIVQKRDEPIGSSAFSASKLGFLALPARLVLGLCLLATILSGIIWVGGDNLMDKLSRGPGEFDNTVKNSSRINIWTASVELIKDHPIAGIGFGGYRNAITKYDDVSGNRQIHQAHNDYLDILAAGGVIGAAIFVWFFVVFIRMTGRQFRRATDFHRSAIVGAWIGLFGVAVHSLVDFGLHVTANIGIFTALVVVAIADANNLKTNLIKKD